MNPNYLAKDELVYELKARGITSEGDTNSLRKLFRLMVTRGLPIDIGLVEDSQVGELLEEITKKTSELQKLVTQTEKTRLPSLANRVQTKVLHLRGRLCHIEAGGQPSQQRDVSRIKQVFAQLESIEELMATAQNSVRPEGQVEEERPTQEVSTPVDLVNPAPTPVYQPPIPGQVPVLGERQAFNASSYQKLPHPLSCLLKEIPIIDGGDVDQLWLFLSHVLRLRQLGRIH
jgi:hypothetical protein